MSCDFHIKFLARQIIIILKTILYFCFYFLVYAEIVIKKKTRLTINLNYLKDIQIKKGKINLRKTVELFLGIFVERFYEYCLSVCLSIHILTILCKLCNFKIFLFEICLK